jgi:hypothetical protein
VLSARISLINLKSAESVYPFVDFSHYRDTEYAFGVPEQKAYHPKVQPEDKGGLLEVFRILMKFFTPGISWLLWRF